MKRRIDFLILFTIITSLVLFSISVVKETNQASTLLNEQLNTLGLSIKDEYKKRLEESVNHTITFIHSTYLIRLKEQNSQYHTHKQELNENYKKLLIHDVKEYLYDKIFDKTRYLWINEVRNFKGGDNYAIRLIHPNLKDKEGEFLSTNMQDIKGNFPYEEELVGAQKENGVFFTYYFKELNSDKITEKLSYAKLYKNLNWIISTGIPVNTLNSIINKQKNILENSYTTHMNKLMLIKFSIMFIFIASLLFFRKKLHIVFDENKKLNQKLATKLQSVQTNLNKFFDLPLNLLVILKDDGTIVELNSGWNKILGYDSNLLGTNIFDILHPNDRQKAKKEIEKLKEVRETEFLEIRLKAKNGSYKTFVCSANSSKKENLIYGTAQDITELKEKTNLIYQQSKMASLGEMTANIAHQWRQPLSVISTASSGMLLKKELGDLDDEFLEDTLNQITNSTKYLSDTIEDFRNFYSPHKEKNSFTISHIINKMLKLIEKRYLNNDIQIYVNIEDIEILNYENELLQVLINLTNNARDQLVSKTLEKKFIQINSYKKEENVFIEVIDNGGGIKDEIIQRIFEPYFTTKDKAIGTGIGLYMSEEIVTKHLKGEITVSNMTVRNEDKSYTGARFCIKLDV